MVFAGLGAPASAVAEAGESDAPSTRAIVSPGSARMPSTAPTATSCLGCTIIWKSTPSAGLSTLLVILSVSTSNRSSPCLTAAPSATNHLETLPVFMVRPSFGMASSMLTAVLLRCCVLRRKAAFLPSAGPMPSAVNHAAVNKHGLPGHVVGVRPGQIGNKGGHVFRCFGAAKGYAFAVFLVGFALGGACDF